MCNNPNHLFIIGLDKFTGKKVVKVYPKYITTIWCTKSFWSLDPSDWRGTDKFLPDKLHDQHRFQLAEYIEVPCGKCAACLQRKSRDWSTRMQLELPYYKTSNEPTENEVWFVTLTYNDKNLPVREYTVTDDGIIDSYQDKTAIQKFIKRVRKKAMEQHSDDPDFKFKYYCTAELGSRTKRLHYHLILFGIRLPDATNVYIDKDTGLRPRGRNGMPYYYSDLLESRWADYLGQDSDNKAIFDSPYGFVTLGLVSPMNMKYTAKYSSKGDSLWHCQSSKPALGRRFFDDNLVTLLYDKKIVYHSESLTINCPFPRYYVNLIKNLDKIVPERIASFIQVLDKDDVVFNDAFDVFDEYFNWILPKRLQSYTDDLMSKTSMSRNDYLDAQEDLLLNRIERYRSEHNYF